MRKPALVLFGLFFTSAFAANAAEPTKEDVQKYLTDLRMSHNKLHSAGTEFGKAIGPALKGEANSVADLNRKYRECSKILAKVRADTKSFRVPDSATAREVARLNEVFLDTQVDIILKVLPEIIDLLEDANLDGDAKKKNLTQIFGQAETLEKGAGDKVRKACTSWPKSSESQPTNSE